MELIDKIKEFTANIGIAMVVPTGKHSMYAQRHVLLAYVKHRQVSVITRCECGTLVHFIANHSCRMWQCPLCGAGYPYVFWKIKSLAQYEVNSVDDLIVCLALDACKLCGESRIKAPCRCQRTRKSEISEGIRQVYEGDDAHEVKKNALRVFKEQLADLDAEISRDLVGAK